MTAMSPLHNRGLGSTSHKNNNFTPHQVLVTQIVAISCASLSLMFTFVASYWFIRMRKSFRHKYVSCWSKRQSLTSYRLLMLLIQSDMFKAIWYFTFPLVAFVRGPIPTSSPFCQVAGFCIAFGTEASGELKRLGCLLRLG
jgi:G protein-coupled receptor GPR1